MSPKVPGGLAAPLPRPPLAAGLAAAGCRSLARPSAAGRGEHQHREPETQHGDHTGPVAGHSSDRLSVHGHSSIGCRHDAVIRCAARRWGPAGRPGWPGRRRRPCRWRSRPRSRRPIAVGEMAIGSQMRCGSTSGPDDAQTAPSRPPARPSTRRLDQELPADHRRPGAERLAQADLPGPLGDRHQHDVHDADAADQQRERRDARQQDGQRLLDRGRGGQQRLLAVMVKSARSALVMWCRFSRSSSASW